MLFSIYHPIDDSLNTDLVSNKEYKLITTFDADNMDEAYEKAQNHNEQYNTLNVRSTSVGDIVRNVPNDVYRMVAGIGWKAITPTVNKITI